MIKAKENLKLYEVLPCGITDNRSYINVKAGEIISYKYSFQSNYKYIFYINDKVYRCCHASQFVKLDNE